MMEESVIEDADAAINVDDTGVILLKETLRIANHDCEVVLTNEFFMWEIKKKKVTIPIRFIVAVSSPVKDSCCSKRSTGEDFTLIYVNDPDLKSLAIDLKWNLKKVTFRCGDSAKCDKWIESIENRLISPEFDRPKRLLIFISPKSGSGKAKRIYDKDVAPLLKLAGVETDVIVTEKKQHPQEVLQTYDLKSIDGVIAVGGDGTLQEVVAGLYQRIAKDKNIDVNKKDLELSETSLRVGMIAAGSGNGMAAIVNGSWVPQTSILHVILGYSMNIDLGTVHDEDGKFIEYMSLLFGTGTYSDAMADSENYRYLGPSRYMYCMFKVLHGGPRILNIEADILQNSTDEDSLPVHRKVEGDYVMVLMSTIQLSTPESNSYLGDGCIPLLCLIKRHKIIEFGKFYHRIIKRRSNWSDFDMLELHEKVKECRIRFGPKSSSEDEIHEEKTRTISVDGEILKIEKPDLVFKMHTQVLKTFGRKVGW